MKLSEIKCLLLDMDGTVYLGDRPIGGVGRTLSALRERGIRLIFLTNNSSKTEDLYREKLARLGLWDDRDAVYTSGMAACAYLKAHFPGKKTFIVATEAVKSYFEREGILSAEKDAEVALLAYDTEITYEKIAAFDRCL